MFTVITLHGELGRIADKAIWKLSVKSVGEGLRAIELSLRRKNKSIFDYLATHQNGGAEYRVLIDGKDHTCFEELVVPLKHYKSIDIVPVPQGSGNSGLWSVVIGVILVIAGVALAAFTAGQSLYISGLGVTIAAGTVSAIATALILNGVALAIGGLVQLLSHPSETDDSKTKGSYLFSQVLNSVNQGGPIPVGYGKMIIGSQVISSTVRTVDFGTVVDQAGELQVDTSDHPNPAVANTNVLALAGNVAVLTTTNDPRNPLADTP